MVMGGVCVSGGGGGGDKKSVVLVNLASSVKVIKNC